MVFRKILAAAVVAGATFCAGAASAALVFIGSWQVDQGPAWDGFGLLGPDAYTAQEAAALLFGGDPGDYAISTAGEAEDEIDLQAWYSILGLGVGVFDQDYSAKHLGRYYGPTADHDNGEFGPASAYVNDFAIGDRYTNYAFREDAAAPEPATWVLMIGGFGLAGAALRRRSLATPGRPGRRT